MSLSSGGEISRENSDTSTPTVPPHGDGSDGVQVPPAEERAAKVAAKKREFVDEYPVRAKLPVAAADGTAVRRDYAHVETEEWVEDQPDTPRFEIEQPASGEEVVDVTAFSWEEAVEELLQSYLRTEATTVNLERRWPDEVDTYAVDAENRWMAEYQKRYFGQLDAWLRELTGGKRPSGGEAKATFENPKVALLTRSASSTPEGQRVPPIEHAAAVRDSWEPVYHTLRNTLRADGYELGEDWQYWRVVEPHTGDRGDGRGTNTCYAHEHTIVVVDGDVDADTFRPAIEKHVETCEWAGEDAHGDGAIEVREPDELNNVAAYVADYCSIDPVPLTERDPDYVAFAAAVTAGNIRTVTRSEAATAAAKADACKQRYESEESDQDTPHGERVKRKERGAHRDPVIACAVCGSAHGIDQDQTLTAARTGGGPEVVADGGVAVRDRGGALREAWSDATAGATVGESRERAAARERVRRYVDAHPDADRVEVEAGLLGHLPTGEEMRELWAEMEAEEFDPTAPDGFRRAPEWEVVSVEIDGEESGASGGNGVEMVEVVDERERLRRHLPDLSGSLWTCDCGVTVGPASVVGHLLDHGFGDMPERAVEAVEAVEVDIVDV